MVQVQVLHEVEFREKAMSAAMAAVLSALIVNPLDVAKTRLQAQAAGRTLGALGPILETCPPVCPRSPVAGAPPLCPPRCYEYRGTWDVLIKVVRQEGVARLWHGTSAGLAIAVPTVGIYLPCYDVLREWLEVGPDGKPTRIAPYAPLVAGSISRSIACVVCAPLELARTRMQANRQGASPPGIGKTLSEVMSRVRSGPGSTVQRVRVLWTGVGAQLMRDVPFSAICWTSLEPVRRKLLRLAGPEPTVGSVVASNFTAGAIAGAFAAFATCPLDVAKTRRQIQVDPSRAGVYSTLNTLEVIWRENGARGLFAGVVPRVGRAAPSVAIVVSFYEVVKHLLGATLAS